jgi:subtilisin
LNSRGSGRTSQVVCGVDWVAANAGPRSIRVANMSLGGTGSSLGSQTCANTTDPERQAICRATAAGVTVVAAAGNSGWDFDYAPAPDVPAAYPEVLTVTAVSDSDGRPGASGGPPSCRSGESDDRFASFSNYAATADGAAHTIAAPGVCIRSTWPSGGYDTISGTSMATPHASGTVALCISSDQCRDADGDGRLAPSEAIAAVREQARAHSAAAPAYGFAGDPLRPLTGRYFGYLAWDGGY